MTPASEIPPRDRLGVCQWFHYEDRESVRRAVDLLLELGVRHLRTGISWADDHRPRGHAWHDWMMRQLEPFDILLSVWHTPPSIAENGACNGPPRRLDDYADFIEHLIARYAGAFDTLELWNEPNNRLKWDFDRCDPDWSKFARMVGEAARRASAGGVRTVLGGMIPVDRAWLTNLAEAGALDAVDVVAIHGFPEMWWDDHPNWEWYRDWHGWQAKIDTIAPAAGGRPIWVTETGLATVDLDTNRRARHALQVRMLEQVARCTAERVYWYSLIDLAPHRDAIEGFHVDENEYHLGLVEHGGRRKPAFDRFRRMLAERSQPRRGVRPSVGARR